MPIDIIISPEVEIGKSILRRLNTPGAFNVVPFADGRVKLLAIEIGEDCPIINMPIRQIPDLFPDLHARIVGVRREDAIFAPSPDDPLYVGDSAFFIVRSGDASRLLEIVGNQTDRARHIVIIGGGNIGAYVAAELEGVSGIRARIIELDKAKAEEAAVNLKHTVILNGDAMNADIQEEAGVQNAELVLCLTNDDKTNILSGVLAKKLGARNTVSLINEVSMQELQAELGIDMVIDPRATTVSSILRHVRRGRILDVYTLMDGSAEVIEGEVLDSSPLAGKRLDEAGNIEGISIGAIISEGKVIYPTGSYVTKAGDHVVLLAEKTSLREVEQLFRVNLDYF